MGKREREGAGRPWRRCALLMAALAFAGVAVVTGRPSLAAELPAVDAVERLAAKAPGVDAVERLAAMRPGVDAVERLAAKGAVVEMAGAETVPPIDARQLAALPARYIGPVGVSGRVTSLAVVEAHPDVIYAGAAVGGVWKSTDGGAVWRPIFDAQRVAAIGALAVFQANPDIVWAATGEANFHVTAASGDGVYRSLDGGASWAHVGLGGSGHIARILLDPGNADVAWVAATGPMWAAGGERGVYKTVDGGRSWRRVLFVDEATGAGDLALDPGNPRRLLANLWQVRRRPWELRSGGPGSGLYLSEDGGEHWTRLGPAAGLPAGTLGRMKLAFAPSRPSTAYAMVELDKAGALLRSDDGGRTWKEIDRRPNLYPRPFYFAEMKVDPRRPDRLYSVHFNLDVSDDGGKSWQPRLHAGVHPDMHALWIDPANPEHLLVATDGGVYESRDGGRSATRRGELPLGQLNHAAVDLDVPYHVYGGTQDNGSWRGASQGWEAGGIPDRAWDLLSDSDGNVALPDPTRPAEGYAMAQNGELTGWNLTTGEWRDRRPRATGGRLAGAPAGAPTDAMAGEPRFGWTPPLVADPFDPAALYSGSQVLLHSADRGISWSALSPDLTTNEPAWQHQDDSGGLTPDAAGAEAYTTISAIAPSPRERGTIWVGTDDGRVQVTRDGGAHWRSVESRVPGVPAHAWVAQVRASPFAAGAAFVAFDNHRHGDDRPYVAATDDFGDTWRRLDAAPVRGFARTLALDPLDPRLLFLGTQAGLWVSFDGGGRWLAWPTGAADGELPPAPVADLVVHPRDGDLVVATHGRGFYVVDDIAPLRRLAGLDPRRARLLPIADVRQHWVRFQDVGGRPGPHGEERPYGALLTVWLPGGTPGKAATEVGKPAAESGRPAVEEGKPAVEEGKPAVEEGKTAVGAGKPVAEVRKPTAEAGKTADEAGKTTGGVKKPDGAEKTPAGAEGKSAASDGKPAMGAEHPAEMEVRVDDAAGRRVRTFTAPAQVGLNRVVWGLEHDALARLPRATGRGTLPERAAAGPEVPPGEYRVTVRVAGGVEVSGEVRVLPDPRSTATPAEWQVRWAALWRVQQLRLAVVEAVERVRRGRADLAGLAGLAGLAPPGRPAESTGPAGPVAPPGNHPTDARPAGEATRAARIDADLERLEARLVRARREPLGSPRRDLGSRLVRLGDDLESGMTAPTPGQNGELRQAEAAVAAALTDVNRYLAAEVAPLRAHLAGGDAPRLAAESEPDLVLPPAVDPAPLPPAVDPAPLPPAAAPALVSPPAAPR